MIVLAGGIGSGKSVVSRILRLKGLGVFDCDYEARVLMDTDGTLIEGIKEIAGAEIYGEDGKIMRPVLAQRLFSNPSLRFRINGLVHTAVKVRMESWLVEGNSNIFVETAIPAESGIADYCGEVWIVDADREERMRRVGLRDGRSREEIERIMDVQALEEKRVRESGKRVRVIANNPDDNLLEQLNGLLKVSGIDKTIS